MTSTQKRKSLLYKIDNILALMLAVNLVGCGFFSSAPESRARDFVKVLIMEPDNDQRLRELSRPGPTQSPLQLVDTLAAKVAVDYLRAKYRQGIKLDFQVGDVQNQGDSRKVDIIVIDSAKAKAGAPDKVRFSIFVEKGSEGWMVTRMSAGE
jgi:hypothetical protein